MRKVITFALILCVILCGCGSRSAEAAKESVSAEELPHVMQYAGKDLPMTSVTTYEGRDSVGYTLFLVAEFDVSAFTDREIKALTDNSSGQAKLRVDVFLTSEANDMDMDTASHLGTLHLTDRRVLQVVHMSKIGEYYDSFDGSKYSYVISVNDGDSALPTYKLICTGTAHPSGVSEIPEPLHGQIAAWLYDKAQFYADMIGR